MSKNEKAKITVGIAIDKWKLATFEPLLKAAGFTWDKHEGVADTWLLKVVIDASTAAARKSDMETLTEVVRRANKQSRAS